MKNIEARSRKSEVNDRRERPVFDRLRGISSLALVGALAFATLVPGRAAFVFAQKPQVVPATPQAGTVPAQIDYSRPAGNQSR